MATADAKVKRQLKNIEKRALDWWGAVQINSRYESRPKRISEILTNGINEAGITLKGAEGASLGVSTLSLWHANFAMRELMGGQTQRGWQLIHRGLIGHYWANETYLALQTKQGKLYSEYVGGVDNVLFFFCVAVHLEQWALAESYAKHIVALYDNKVLEWELDDNEPHLSHFVYGLAKLVLNGAVPDSAQLLANAGCYGKLFAQWDEPDSLQASLCACFDYHVEAAAKGIKGNPYNAFSSVAAALLPFELLAFIRLWSRHHDRKVLVCDHPMLRPEFMHCEASPPEYNDDLLDAFVTSAKAYCGIKELNGS